MTVAVETFSKALPWHDSARTTAFAMRRMHVDDQAFALMVVSRRKGWPAAYDVAEALAVLR